MNDDYDPTAPENTVPDSPYAIAALAVMLLLAILVVWILGDPYPMESIK